MKVRWGIATNARAARNYPFLGLLAFMVDFASPLEATFGLLFRASTAASISAVWRALCVALRWLARRFISFALFVPIGFSRERPKRSTVGVLQTATFYSKGGSLSPKSIMIIWEGSLSHFSLSH
jgi:hypothetical protein